MEYGLYHLKNGLSFLHRPGLSKGITHLCIIIHVGSRDEKNEETGMAHFVEHMLFKGTKTRNNRQILNFLELVGGEINAYTTKEYTCIYASFLDEYLVKALRLISDMIMNSTFPKAEIEREKGVIGDEIDSYKDIPEEYIQDDFDEIIFGEHTLGKNILGTKHTINRFGQKDLEEYSKTHFFSQNMVLGIYNGLPSSRMQILAEKYFGNLNSSEKKQAREECVSVNPIKKVVKAPIHQVHGIIGARSYSLQEPQRMAMQLIMNLLGGPGMSSRLNLEIREKRGICYQIEANYSPLSDTGIFSIYFGTDPEKYEKCISLIHKELTGLCKKGLSSLYLHQSKTRFKGQIALADENHASVLISLCKAVQDYGRADSIREIFSQIDQISNSQILEIANSQLDPKNLSSLILVPSEN